jgi:parallel beta-helix repeat protein
MYFLLIVQKTIRYHFIGDGRKVYITYRDDRELHGRNDMLKRLLLKNAGAVVIAVLCVGLCLVPASAFDQRGALDQQRGNTLYVGGSGPGNYTKIQDAIDNASSGDTVFVYQGVYDEHVRVDKALALIGESQTSTVIDGQGNGGHTVTITEAGVTLSGFTLQNCGDISNAAELFISSDNNQIIENTMNCTTTPHGEEAIWCWNASGNIIQRNTIQNHYCGIWLEYCSNTVLSNNTILNNGDLGIVLGNTKDTTISDNIVSKNTIGICLRDSCNNTVAGNTVTKNTEVGIEVIEMDAYSTGNAIVKNNFMRNRMYNALFVLAKQSHSKNLWDEDYWGRPFLFPKVISGRRVIGTIPGIPFHFPGMTVLIPWFTADWHPAQSPYITDRSGPKNLVGGP